jgi:hypothetical protein
MPLMYSCPVAPQASATAGDMMMAAEASRPAILCGEITPSLWPTRSAPASDTFATPPA